MPLHELCVALGGPRVHQSVHVPLWFRQAGEVREAPLYGGRGFAASTHGKVCVKAMTTLALLFAVARVETGLPTMFCYSRLGRVSHVADASRARFRVSSFQYLIFFQLHSPCCNVKQNTKYYVQL